MGAKLSHSSVVNKLKSLDNGISITGEYLGSLTKTSFKCSNNHNFTSTPNRIFNGVGCPTCVIDSTRRTKESINLEIADRGIELIGDYTNAKSNTLFKHICGYEWLSNSNRILRGGGCPACVEHIFKWNLPSHGYLLKFDSFIKYGISSNLQGRLYGHRKNGDYEVIATKLFSTGREAYEWEKSIKTNFGGSFVSKDICPDGFTETLSLEHLNLVSETLRPHTRFP
jgi:hypothetical protein